MNAHAPSLRLAAHAGTMERILRARRRRALYFGPGLFRDPAWDMLLDLGLARAGGRQLDLTALGHGAGIPSTTALRWIDVLLEHGLARRSVDPADARRGIITLTDKGEHALFHWLEQQSR